MLGKFKLSRQDKNSKTNNWKVSHPAVASVMTHTQTHTHAYIHAETHGPSQSVGPKIISGRKKKKWRINRGTEVKVESCMSLRHTVGLVLNGKLLEANLVETDLSRLEVGVFYPIFIRTA